MRRDLLPIGMFAVAGLLATATIAQAGIESWVSGTGKDAGTCPITAPCRTFAYAHGQTSNNGAINVLSSGSFGPVTITKPISIVAEGAEAVINTGAGGAGIIVQTGASSVVSLRGLTIDMLGAGNNTGISFVSGAALHVHDTVIRKASTGILFAPTAGRPELYVSNSVVANIAGFGISVNPTGSAGAKAMLDHVRVENSTGNGIEFQASTTTGTITATVRDSVTTGNGAGIRALQTGSASINVMVDRTASVNNTTGIFAFGSNVTIRMGDSTVTGNTTGLSAAGGVIASYGTNKVNGNGTDGTAVSIAMQ